MKDELFYLIISDNKFSNELIKKFPGLYSYITAYRQNASPEHNEKCKNIINKFYDENEHFRKHLLNYIKDNSNEPRVDGKVFEIANDEEDVRAYAKVGAPTSVTQSCTFFFSLLMSLSVPRS